MGVDEQTLKSTVNTINLKIKTKKFCRVKEGKKEKLDMKENTRLFWREKAKIESDLQIALANS